MLRQPFRERTIEQKTTRNGTLLRIVKTAPKWYAVQRAVIHGRGLRSWVSVGGGGNVAAARDIFRLWDRSHPPV